MGNQHDASDPSFNIKQIKWAMRHGQAIEGLENAMRSGQPIIVADHPIEHSVENNDNTDHNPLHNTVFEEEIDKLGTSLSQQMLSWRNELAMFVQAELHREAAGKRAEWEWKKFLEERDTKLQTDMREMQYRILTKFEEYFQHLDQKLQNNENIVRQELALLTSQLAERLQLTGSKEEVVTCSQNMEVQQKLRENVLIREMSALKEEIISITQKWKSLKKRCVMVQAQQYNISFNQQEMDEADEAPTRVYQPKKKRRS